MTRRLVLLALALLLAATPAGAHVTERALVLLLPTDIYIPAGVAVVALTVVMLAYMPPRWLAGFERIRRTPVPGLRGGETWTSLAATLFLLVLVVVGLTGPRDPLANPLPLTIWTVWFVGFTFLLPVFGDLWRWVNPWAGLHRLLTEGRPPPLPLPRFLGHLPAILGFLAFAWFMLADIAPADPARLAWAVLAYWVAMMAGTMAFGTAWLDRGEWITVYFRLLAKLAPVATEEGRLTLAVPGGRLAAAPALPLTGGVFVLAVLAAGSFDGLNETFWWLAQIDVNPLEFPGRSAVVRETTTGLFGSVALLIVVFTACVVLGLGLIGELGRFREAFGRLALSLVPIAFGYHLAHYLTVLLVNGQYAIAAVNDPLSTGADLLGLGEVHVTTSFFNVPERVERIWLTQAGGIVIGHVVGVIVAHAIALEMFGTARRAAISQLPVAAFMVLYTLFGLWLLASPTGA